MDRLAAEIERLVPAQVWEALCVRRAAIMGGLVRAHFDGSRSKDVDVFVFERSLYEELVRATSAGEVPSTLGFVHEIEGEPPIQLILANDVSTPEGLSATADFDIAAGVYSGGEIILPPGFEQAVTARTMRYRGSQAPPHSYDRYLKYAKVGYIIDDSINLLLADWRRYVE